MSASFEPGKLEEIKSLAVSGKKIEAIKRYREATGVGLAEAKEAVEAIARGQKASFPAAQAPATAYSSDGRLENRIRQLLAARQKIEAVKIYRERYNCGLKEAKDAVDAIEVQMRGKNVSGDMPPLNTANIDPFAEGPGRRERLAAVFFALLIIMGAALFLIFLRGGM